MPLPLVVIPIVLGAVTLGGIVMAAVPKILKILNNRTVAILGAPQTGKTALIRVLRDADAPDRGLPAVNTGGDRGRFQLVIKGKTVDFAVPQDLPGSDGLSAAEWKKAFADADHVWYLFRADLMANGDAETAQMVKTHVALLGKWISANPVNAPRVLLIGTWADQHQDYARHAARLLKSVQETSTIKFGSVKLNGAAVVIGSLATPRDADKLLKGITSRLQ